MIERDNLHYNFREIDGYNKDINIVMSAREPGKTTSFWLDKVYFPWVRDKRPWIEMVRHATEITAEYIYTIQNEYLNKFLPDDAQVELEYSKSKLESSIVDIKIEGEVFVRFVSLNADMRTIKRNVLPKARGAFMDEFIINPEFKEKYLPDEFSRIEECFTTWKRACPEGHFKLYFLGNSYSLYHPLLLGLKVNVNQLRRGKFYVGDTFVIQWALINPLLREKLLRENPFMQLDEDYGKYALEGYNMNDNSIRISSRPRNFSLDIVVKFNKYYIGFYKNNFVEDRVDIFHCEIIKDFSDTRKVFAFEFTDMVKRTQLFTRDDKSKFYRFRLAIGRNLVTFSSPEVYYMVVEIYKYL